MKSAGCLGQVNNSKAAYNLLINRPDLELNRRGIIEAKGKGEIEMWFVGLKNQSK